jgi:hypothetical protein
MLNNLSKKLLSFLFLTLFVSESNAQLSSFEVLGGLSGIDNPTPAFKMNGTKELGLRFNQKIGWLWAGNLTAGLSNVYFNTASKFQNDYSDLQNKYQFLQIGANFNALTFFRTLRGSWKANKWTMKIICKGFKWYLCGGVEFLKLKESSDNQSRSFITNVYGGTGIEIIRLGKGAKHGYPAFVPFIELKYFHNTSGGYYNAPIISFDKITYSLGLKYTYGLPQSK